MLPKNIYIGEFASLQALWARLPNGGIEGEYVKINGVEYAWDKYERNWKTTDGQNNGNNNNNTGGGNNSGGTTTIDNNSGNPDSHCGCQQVVNVYCGCGCGDNSGGGCDDLKEQVEANRQEIAELQEIINNLGSGEGTDSGSCQCAPTQITLHQEDYCQIDLTLEECYQLGILRQPTETDDTETSNDLMENLASGYVIQRPTIGTVCARVSLPADTIEQRLFGIFIDSQYATLCDDSSDTGGTSERDPLPLLG